MLCIFDIETIPDVYLLQEMYDFRGSGLEIAKAAFSAQKEKSGSEFLPHCFHRVVSISSVICDEYGKYRKVGHFGSDFLESVCDNDGKNAHRDEGDFFNQYYSREFLDTLESTLLSEFWHFMNKSYPKLVSFNGRGFDIPVLCLRAMRYNINAHAFFEQNNPMQNLSKWENYRTRYSEGFHVDLYECLGHFGAIRTLNLDSVCKMLNVVGKYDMSGKEVYELYLGACERHQSPLEALENINHYCHSDVLNTYWLYLKYELLKGNILGDDYNSLLEHWLEHIPRDKPYSAVFIDCISRHITAHT